jgi:hypothetical protein
VERQLLLAVVMFKSSRVLVLGLNPLAAVLRLLRSGARAGLVEQQGLQNQVVEEAVAGIIALYSILLILGLLKLLQLGLAVRQRPGLMKMV